MLTTGPDTPRGSKYAYVIHDNPADGMADLSGTAVERPGMNGDLSNFSGVGVRDCRAGESRSHPRRTNFSYATGRLRFK